MRNTTAQKERMVFIVNSSAIVPEGYAYYDENYLVDNDTGEIVESFTVNIPVGSSFQTEKDRERNRQAKAEREERERLRNRCKEKFYFVSSDDKIFEGISPMSVTRLIYLGTYVNYDNRLVLSQRVSIRKKDLPEILDVSVKTSYAFWKEVSPKFITENEKGELVLSESVIKRGDFKRKQYSPYQQFYDDGVRKIYKSANGKHHKHLGYLFKLLPYISVEFNLLCFNPSETDIEKVELMSIEDFCDAISYDVNCIHRLKDIYNKVRFDVNGRQERFCTMIYNGIDTKDAKICINPSILYSGTNEGRVEITKLYFRD